MRIISLLVLGVALASCTTAPPSPTSNVRAEAELQKLIGGRVAGPAQACLPLLPTRGDMVVIDDETVVFKGGRGGSIYVNHLSPGCTGVGLGNALVTKQTGSSLCAGDIATVQNLSSGIQVGNCTIGEFVPYTKTGA